MYFLSIFRYTALAFRWTRPNHGTRRWLNSVYVCTCVHAGADSSFQDLCVCDHVLNTLFSLCYDSKTVIVSCPRMQNFPSSYTRLSKPTHQNAVTHVQHPGVARGCNFTTANFLKVEAITLNSSGDAVMRYAAIRGQ